MLRPYVGRRWKHLGDPQGVPHSTREYGSDNSGEKLYAFNSAGFRGEEYDPQARYRIVVCGCSMTFGEGLDIEETWPYRFKELFARARGCAPSDVNLLNLAQGGASNSYIARTLLSQVGSLRADLVVVQFTYAARAEWIFKGTPFDVGPWMMKTAAQQETPWSDAVQGYYLYYSDEVGFIETLKHMLLLQFAYRCHRTPYLFSWLDHKNLDDDRFRRHHVIAPLLPLLDWPRICRFSLVDKDIFVDSAADEDHPGPLSSQAFANRLFSTYAALPDDARFGTDSPTR